MDTLITEYLLRKLFETFESVNLRYVVLRNYEEYPQKILKPDIGILIDPDHIARLEQAVSRVAAELGYAYYRKLSTTNIISLYLADCSHDGENWCGETLKIDARIYEVFRFSKRMKKIHGFNYKVFFNDIGRRSVEQYGCKFYVFRHIDELVSLCQQWRRKEDPRHLSKIFHLLENESTRTWFETATGHPSSEKLFTEPQSTQYDLLLEAMVTSRWGSWTSRFAGTQLRTLVLYARRTRERMSRKGGVFYFSGPDGSGKTTALDEVKAYFKLKHFPYTYLYTQHKILRSIGKRIAWLGYMASTDERPRRHFKLFLGQGNGYLDRDTGKVLWKVGKFAGLLASLLDVFIGRLFLVEPNRWAGRSVFVETSPYDLFVKYHMPSFPRLERIVCPYIPRPDAGYLMTATPKQITDRKAELTREEISKYYLKFWYLLGLASPHGYMAVNAAGGIGPTAKIIIESILDQIGGAIKLLAADTCNRLDEFEVVSQRDWRRVIRRSWKQNRPVIIKLWARPDAKGMIRRALNISSANYEWRNLQILHDLGVRVPKPMGFVNIGRNPSGHTDVLIMEDLGDCQLSITYLKSCIQEGNEEGIKKLDAALIDITVQMVRGKILDWDHALVNIVVTQSGEVVRLDLEQARKVQSLRMNTDLYARMLSRFITSYTYAVQPDTTRVNDFIKKLFAQLMPSTSVLQATQKLVDAILLMQEKKIGIDVRVTLPVK